MKYLPITFKGFTIEQEVVFLPEKKSQCLQKKVLHPSKPKTRGACGSELSALGRERGLLSPRRNVSVADSYSTHVSLKLYRMHPDSQLHVSCRGDGGTQVGGC